MEEAASGTSQPSTHVYDTLLDLFGEKSKDKIDKAIELTKQSGNVQLETAIEIMFELLNQETTSGEEKKPPPPTIPPQKPSRSNIQTGTKKKTPNYSLTSQVVASRETREPQVPSLLMDDCRVEMSAKFLPDEFKNACDMIEKGYKVMILMRGLPGSGKSFLARQIVQNFNFDPRNHIFSADDYFINVNGDYVYDQTKLTEAHEFTQNNAIRKLRESWSPVIIDNTNIKLWNMFPYIRLGVQYRYKIIILEPVTPWATTPKTLMMKNQHNVPKDRIRNMMDNYEKTNVTKLLHTLNLHEAYLSTPTEFRHYPPFTRKFIENHRDEFPELLPQQTEVPKPRREIFDQKPSSSSDPTECESIQVNADTIDWQSYEQDNFWSKMESPGSPEKKKKQIFEATSSPVSVVPKPKRETTTQFSLLDSLQEMAREERTKFQTEQQKKEQLEKQSVPELIRQQEDLQKELVKHKKECRNENKMFREIRQMFPSVGISYLWDLFVNCKGDPDWAIEILINDPKVNSYQDPQIAEEDFECETCDTVPKPLLPPSKPQTPPILNETKEKRPKKVELEEQEKLKRLIEESFVIGDEHYSPHTRKIRNFKHGVVPTANLEVMELDEETSSNAGSNLDEEEVVEIDLGLTFVQKLEELYGTNVFKVENDSLMLGDLKLKTNIFLTKGLGQQLYALWCESVHNQLEEHRLKIAREDLELARQLDAREKYPGMFREEQPKTFQDIIEIEKALNEYKQDISKWKKTLPDTIAYNLAKDKLLALFPNVDREVAIEILAAHKNNLDETVKVLKNTLKNDVNEQDLEKRGKELFAQAQQEIDKLQSTRDPDEFSKLSPEDTKRAALKEFEEARNIAMHHAQLKAECVAKARTAIQRNEHGVAFYYTQISELHKNKIDFYNNRAANCLVEVHNVSQNSENMLDLHYLHSSEAIQCLDLFLDKQIQKLITIQKTYAHVYVITGRGKNSVNGIPAIKIRVKGRLRERDLKFSEVNPGLLKVKVFHNSMFA